MLLNCGVGEDSWESLGLLARRSNQSILKETGPEYSLEGLMLRLKLQYFGRLMWRTDSLEKTLMLRKIEGRRRRGQQRMKWMASPTRWTWVWASSRRWWRTRKPGVLQVRGVTKSQTQLSNWTELKSTEQILRFFLSFFLFRLWIYPTVVQKWLVVAHMIRLLN